MTGLSGMSGMVGAPSSLLTGLISYWKLDEAAGVTRADSFGTNNLTDNGTVGQATGKLGNAASFTNTVGQYLAVASNGTLQHGGTDFTWAFWYNPADLAATYSIINKSTAGQREVQFTLNGAQGRVELLASSDGNVWTQTIATPNSSITAGAWHFIVGRYDGVNIYVSVNGGAENSQPLASVWSGTAALEFGRNTESGQNDKGLLDAVAFAKRSWSAADISKAYNGGSGLEFPWN